jgi:transposase
VVNKRENWRETQKNLSKKNLYFLDESGIYCGMVPTYAWGKKSERVNDYVPDIRFKKTSIIGVLGMNGLKAKSVFKGTLNGERFGEYVKNILAPELKEGDIVVMDNLSVHKVKDVLKPLFDKGIEVVFLPPYSPDFSPLENFWNEMKIMVRKLKVKVEEKLEEAIDLAIKSVSIENILSYFRHTGYLYV